MARRVGWGIIGEAIGTHKSLDMKSAVEQTCIYLDQKPRNNPQTDSNSLIQTQRSPE